MRKSYLLLAACLCAFVARGQTEGPTDVTAHFLENPGFDERYNYDISTNGNVKGDVINTVYGWDKDMDASFTVAGTFAYGSGATFNGSSAIPATGYKESAGGALALSTGWGVSLRYAQPVTLVKGRYALVSAYYNVGSVTTGSSLVGWTPNEGTSSAVSTVNSFPLNTWVTDTIYFTISGRTEGKIQAGFMAVGAVGSGSQAKVLIDYVKVLYYGVDKTDLNARITEAENLYGAGTGIGASVLAEVISQAKNVEANEEADMLEVLSSTKALIDAMFEYQLGNASDDKPLDFTTRITNPSFESAFEGWENNGMATQTNAVFPKNGNTYIEKWVNRSSRIPDVSIQQTLTGMPNGSYTLTVTAGNIQQTAAGSIVNLGAPQTGVCIFAGNAVTAVDTLKDRSVDFFVLNGEVTIGMKAEEATGNWVTCDNFRLLYKGFDIQSIASLIKVQITEAEDLLTERMQSAVRQELESAIQQAQTATTASPLVLDDLHTSQTQLLAMIDKANVSISAYTALQAAIKDANTVYEEDKQGAEELEEAIGTAQSLFENLTESLDGIYSGTEDLYTAILVFRLANSTGAAPKVVTNPYIARGATQAFGRSTVSGVTVANILENGFCWSTHPEPTILDNRTTKYYSYNGSIYHIENLEPSTVYYIRAYALTKTYAVGYGEVVKVITIPKGTITYQLNSSVTGAGDHGVRIGAAIKSAVEYWNNLTSIQGHHLSVNHHAGTPTAEAGYGGGMQFGANASYQRTGTAMHEMGHTIGVGTHSMWYGPSSVLRETGSRGAWLGERANKVVQFFDNDPAGYLRGDAVHMWPYGINGAQEDTGSEILYIANSLIHQGLGEDGLPPTGGFATPAYTFESDGRVKYYIKNEDETGGLKTSYLTEDATGRLMLKSLTGTGAIMNDSAAWYMDFIPTTCYYQIRNVATGKYFTYKSTGTNGIGLVAKDAPTSAESFQLMESRTNAVIGTGDASFTDKGYWFVRPEKKLNPPCLAALTNGLTTAANFNIANSSTMQRWLILSGNEVDLFDQALSPTALPEVEPALIKVYAEDRQVRIENIPTPSDIKIYDVSGNLQLAVDGISDSYSYALPEGAYIVQIYSAYYQEVRKVIVW